MATRRAVGIYLHLLIVMCTTLHVVISSENISLRKTANQSSQYSNFGANRAVDGCTDQILWNGCCSHTAGGQNSAWWRVDLGQLSYIKTIKIFYRYAYKHRLAGYQLYVSTSNGNPTQGTLCYEDKSSNKAEVQLVSTHQCPYVAQYVTMYNYRTYPKQHNWYDSHAFLELCEVEVFGCFKGKYGINDCSQNCSNYCLDRHCDPSDGSCFSCVSGLHGRLCSCSGVCTHEACDDSDYCSMCVPGTYGNTCEHRCSVDCVNNECSKDAGRCNECIQGRYNAMCETECPVHCAANNCTREEGFCYDCATGYHGNKCDQEWPENCTDDICNMDNGDCYECATGYHGSKCDQECPENCTDNLCNMDTGHCYGT